MATAAQPYSPAARFQIPHGTSTQHTRELRASVRRALQHGGRRVIVDCGGWTQIDVRTLSALLQCALASQEHGAAFEVRNLSQEIEEGLRALGLAYRLGMAD